jgi:hypothetical protein
MKNLKKLQTDGLLKSKSYGLGKEMLWSLTSTRLVRDLGHTPPKSEVHSMLYEHEKDLGDVFVSLALSGRLLEWQGEGDQKKGLRNDRMFRLADPKNYLERERGNQGVPKLREKVGRYVKHYETTREPFNLIFSVDTEEEIERLIYLFEELRLGKQYAATLQQELVTDVLNAQVTSRFDTVLLSNYCSNHALND